MIIEFPLKRAKVVDEAGTKENLPKTKYFIHSCHHANREILAILASINSISHYQMPFCLSHMSNSGLI